MVTLIKKKVKGQFYWYAVKSARVDGKPRIVWQKYLGTANHIAEQLSQGPFQKDIRIQSMPLGHVAALARANDDLQFIDIINKNTKKRSTNGLSVGEYMFLQLVGRAEGKLSRRAIAKWYPNSVVKLILNTPTRINAKNLLKHLDYPTIDAIRSIEDDVSARLVQLGISPTMLLWDTTNFFTRIEKGEDIPQKGHSKEHRNDRNLVGLGLAVSKENIPFFHETFEANMHDSNVFSNVLDVIVERLNRLNVNAKEVVFILDKGNNSDDNVKEVVKRTHIIGTIRYDQAKKHLEVPLDQYDEINDKGLSAYRTSDMLYGEQFTIVITHNSRTSKKQTLKYEDNKAKVLKELKALKKRIENKRRKGRPWTQTRAVRAIVDVIPMNMRSVFDYDVRKKVGRGGGLMVDYAINAKNEALKYKSFGKIVHFTDLHEWSSEQIATSYNSKYNVEDDFRWLKDKLMIPIKPINVRTDQHIRAHVFICVMGLLFYRYLQWKLKKKGLNHSTMELDELLNGIRLAMIFTGSNKKKGNLVVEQMNREEAKVFSALDMAEYISV
jgi:transposase